MQDATIGLMSVREKQFEATGWLFESHMGRDGGVRHSLLEGAERRVVSGGAMLEAVVGEPPARSPRQGEQRARNLGKVVLDREECIAPNLLFSCGLADIVRRGQPTAAEPRRVVLTRPLGVDILAMRAFHPKSRICLPREKKPPRGTRYPCRSANGSHRSGRIGSA